MIWLDGRRVGPAPKELTSPHPGTRRLEARAPSHRTQVRSVNLRPSPPVWLFPLDFPLDLALLTLFDPDQEEAFRLEPRQEGPARQPSPEDLKGLADRGRELGQLRFE